jgi:predicted TIM-barrel fold metal-dependent hydrolase
MIIDVNTHWLPRQLFTDETVRNTFFRRVPREYGEYVEFTKTPGTGVDQIVVCKPKGAQNLNFTDKWTLLGDRLELMDQLGIAKGILRMPIWGEWLDLELCRKCNDWLAEFIKEHPDRFLGLATVPPWADKDCIFELERCTKELGFVGIDMPAHYGDLYLDSEEFRPHFKIVNKMKLPVVIHHTPLPVDFQSLTTYTNVRRSYGRSVSQMTNLTRMLFSNLFEECPDLKIMPTLMGGGFFAYANFLALSRKKSTVKEDLERHDFEAERIQRYLQNNVYFEITHAPPWGEAQLECAVKVLGADHLVWASSYPLRREWLIKGIEPIENLNINEKEKKMILGENAMKLFNIKE